MAGRPKGTPSHVVTTRVSSHVLGTLDGLAANLGTSRFEVMRKAITIGVRELRAPQPAPGESVLVARDDGTVELRTALTPASTRSAAALMAQAPTPPTPGKAPELRLVKRT